LDKIIERKRWEISDRMRAKPLELVRALAEEQPSARSFWDALSKGTRPRIIAECKQRSPSKGVLKSNYDPVALALSYQAGGAAAISVLTDQEFFGGDIKHLTDVSLAVQIPVLRKDFVVDEYQILEARAAGADSFLLISGVLDYAQLQYFCEIGRDFAMEPLVECHNLQEVEIALRTDCKILGINNRDLKTMSIDLNTSVAMASEILARDSSRLLVCESGIKTPQDIASMEASGFSAFLIGESLMLSQDPKKALLDLRS
jgi:indole-3-glycerol phosphate synthase